jgi:hypothetical protein
MITEGVHGGRRGPGTSVADRVYQGIALKRDPTIVSATPTWSVERVLLVPPRQNVEWTDTLDRLVDQSANAWRDVNVVRAGTKALAASRLTRFPG